MFTKDLRKKHKNWMDGIVSLNGKHAELYDMEGKQLAKVHTKYTKLRMNESLGVRGYDVECMGTVPADEFISGRVFMAATAGVTSTELGTGQASAAAAPLRRRRPAGPSALAGKAAASIARSDLAAPAVGKGSGRPAISQTRHNPLAEDACILYWPASAGPHPQAPSQAGDASAQPAWESGAGIGTTAAGTPDVAVVLDPALSKRMRPHQRAGVRFLWKCITGQAIPGQHGSVLADEMGLGKTLTTIALIWTALKQSATGRGLVSRALIVVPSSLVGNWKREFKKWLGDFKLKPVVIEASSNTAAVQDLVDTFVKGSAAAYPVCVLSYEMARKFSSELGAANIGLLIADEGHRLKSAGGNKTIAALHECCTQARIVLTGSPIQNNLDEYYALLSFVCPGLLGPLPAFRRIFADPINSARERGSSDAVRQLGKERAGELARLSAACVLRRTNALLTALLPPKTELTVFCAMTPTQRELYNKVLQLCGAGSVLRGMKTTGEGAPPAAALVLLNGLTKLCTHADMLTAASAEECRSSAASKRGAVMGWDGADRWGPPLPATGDMASKWGGLTPAFPAKYAATPALTQSEHASLWHGDVVTPLQAAIKRAALSDDVKGCPEPRQCARQLMEHTVPFNAPGRMCAALMGVDTAVSPGALCAWFAMSGKLAVVDALLSRLHAGGQEKAVIVSNYTQTLDVVAGLAAVRGWTLARLDGSTPADKRTALVTAFNTTTPRDQFLFLLSSKSGGAGLNLIGASRLLLLDVAWNPATDRQALARIWRDGQKRPVFTYRFVTAGALEEKILQRQARKEEMAGELGAAASAGSGKGGRGSGAFTREELLAIFHAAEAHAADDMAAAGAGACATAELVGEKWPAYHGAAAMQSVDALLGEAISLAGDFQAVPFVGVERFNTGEASSDDPDAELSAALTNSMDEIAEAAPAEPLDLDAGPSTSGVQFDDVDIRASAGSAANDESAEEAWDSDSSGLLEHHSDSSASEEEAVVAAPAPRRARRASSRAAAAAMASYVVSSDSDE